jgi:hypothetical protein
VPSAFRNLLPQRQLLLRRLLLRGRCGRLKTAIGEGLLKIRRPAAGGRLLLEPLGHVVPVQLHVSLNLQTPDHQRLDGPTIGDGQRVSHGLFVVLTRQKQQKW